MFNLTNIKNYQDAIEQLKTIEEEINSPSLYIPLSIASALEELNPNYRDKCQLNIIIDGLQASEDLGVVRMLKHYVTKLSEINILYTNTDRDLEAVTDEGFRIEFTQDSLSTTLRRSKDKNSDIHCIFLFNICDHELEASLESGSLQAYLKRRATKVYLFHNAVDHEITRLLLLKKYNANEISTVRNKFSHSFKNTFIAELISSVDFSKATKHEGYVDSEATIMKMVRNTYFDTRFNSFGLHYTAEIDGRDRPVIFFDYEFCYSPEDYSVYTINEGEFEVVEKTKEDPFPLFSRELKKESFVIESETPYIPLRHKENAARLRTHFSSLLKERIRSFEKCAENMLKECNVDISDAAMKLAFLSISSRYTLRDVTTSDREAFRLLHHDIETFRAIARKNKKLYTAKDHRCSYLIFELVRSDKHYEQVIDFMHHYESLGFNLYDFDSDGYTLLDNAITSSAFKIAEMLIKKGYDVNHQNPFGFTALHRAYAEDNDDAKALLLQRGARELVNSFGSTPKDLSPAEDEEGIEETVEQEVVA